MPVKIRVQYRSELASMEGWVANLSRYGLFLRSDYLESEGVQVALDLSLPGHDTPVRVAGEVVRVDDRPASCGMAIRFCGLNEVVRRELADFMLVHAYQASV